MILAPNDPNLVDALLDARFRRRYLAEGDSWFSLGGLTGNQLMAIDDDDTIIVNCAYPGDTLKDMGKGAFVGALSATDGIRPWTAILLSGGGNDLLKRCSQCIVPDPSGPVDFDALAGLLAEIERHLVRILMLCRSGQPGVPVYMHTYDHPPVSRHWGWWQLGPWVSPVLAAAGVDRTRWDGLAAMLIDNLAELIHKLSAAWPELAVVETRGQLHPHDWRNEIHPKTIGYRKLAQSWCRALNH